MGKRINQEGTIYESPKGSGVWWAQLPAGPDGRRPRRKAHSAEEAVKVLQQMRAEREAGRDHFARIETVAQLMDSFIEGVEASGARPGTIRSYRQIRQRITNHIGNLLITAVEVETIQTLTRKLLKTYHPAVVRTTLGRLHAAFESVIPEKISRNPVHWKKLKIPKGEQAIPEPLDYAVIPQLLAAADDSAARGGYLRYSIAWWLAALLGLRRGEIAGLSWRDLNFEKAEIKVRAQIAITLDGGFAPGPPKSSAGVRTIPIGPQLLARLRIHWETSQAERRVRGARRVEHGYLVCNEDGSFVPPHMLNTDLSRLCRQAQLDHITPHQLRHTVATAISEEGFSEALIMDILGHDKGKSVTRRYIHATDKAKRQAIEAIEARFLPVAAALRGVK